MLLSDVIKEYTDILHHFYINNNVPPSICAHSCTLLADQFNDSNIHYFHDCLQHLITKGKSTWTINKEEDIDQLNGSLEILDLLEGYFFTAEKIMTNNSYISACWELHLIPRDD